MPSIPLTSGLMLVHGNHPEALRDLLVTWIRRYPLAPLETETVLVHSNGIAQWLRLALAEDVEDGGCGIAAGLDLSLPSRFLWQAYRAVLGREAVPEASPFDKPLLVWRLMRLLPDLTGQAAYQPLRRFLAADADLRKRFQLAERLADLFDQYQVYRADWLAAWAAGEDVLIRAAGERAPLPDEQRWQACLWRALLADVADVAAGGNADLAGQGRAAVHEAFLARVAGWPDDAPRPAGLPRRVLVFGISALPRQSLEVLAALARWSQVLMCVHNPCEHYWSDIVADKELLRATRSRQQRRAGAPAEIDEDSLHLHAHPLLAAWGKQGRDFIGLLDEHDSDVARAGYLQHFADIRQRIDLFAPHGTDCLLNQLQDDIRDLRPLGLTRDTWPPVAPGDDSIRFHIAHSPQREVEVLHDQLLAAFNADATLRPRDVIVMVPDIDVYAPHIQAVFGLIDSHDPRYIPFSIADQGQGRHDPLVGAIGKLLELPTSRLAVSDVLDLLDVPALRQRFGIGEDQLPLLRRWVHGARVRWGLHAAHRCSLGLPAAPEGNTWLFGLRRMLLGYAVGGTAGAWNDIEPFDEIGGLDAALLGPLADLLERLEATWQALADSADVATWCQRLRRLLADFFAPDDSADAYTLQQLDLALERWQAACQQAGLDSPLPLAVVGEHWLAQLDDSGLSQRFFAGAVTFATLMPMRAIPFRQVCLLGLNDGDYPRTRVAMDFDLMGRDYRPGDRSRREDDRYLFLEALLSARERLFISWVGRSVKDNTLRPPSVLVGQLRDHLAAGWRLAGREGEGGALLDALSIEHRLQPFNPDYFPADPAASRLFTYAEEWRIADDRPGGSPPLAPPAETPPVTLAELAAFLRDPVKAFFRQRLRVDFDMDDPASEDQEPFDLDGLELWHLWDELIGAQAHAVHHGEPREDALADGLARIQRRGDLAAGAFAALMRETLAAPMEDLFQRYGEALAQWPDVQAHDEPIDYTSPAGLRIEDRLGGLHSNAEGRRGRVVLESSDLVKKGHYQRHTLIKHWVTHLAAHVAGGPLTTVVVGKVGSVTLAPLDPEHAAAHLDAILQAWQAARSRPLPLAVKTAFAWIKDAPPGADAAAEARAAAAARKAYEGDEYTPGERDSSAYLQRAWPDFAAMASGGEFARLAETLLRPLYLATFAKGKPRAAAGDAP
ncbi:exodeoxyribonuclease V subunit gamma [Zoogloea sp.]|uniref:exodeoxyribonuclease V subunit gamma n=1 Tax=Zoogloea sp. TaxID=49181 RepID=UPI002C8E1F80|nr:exodeoxyribonuclease V subunit gamma [Zoogloea sp.]HPI59417.1 exodeoxyribonuclease V subunit gamma [Zoogloea sp.]